MPEDPFSGFLSGYVMAEEQKRQQANEAAQRAIQQQQLTLEDRRIQNEHQHQLAQEKQNADLLAARDRWNTEKLDLESVIAQLRAEAAARQDDTRRMLGMLSHADRVEAMKNRTVGEAIKMWQGGDLTFRDVNELFGTDVFKGGQGEGAQPGRAPAAGPPQQDLTSLQTPQSTAQRAIEQATSQYVTPVMQQPQTVPADGSTGVPPVRTSQGKPPVPTAQAPVPTPVGQGQQGVPPLLMPTMPGGAPSVLSDPLSRTSALGGAKTDAARALAEYRQQQARREKIVADGEATLLKAQTDHVIKSTDLLQAQINHTNILSDLDKARIENARLQVPILKADAVLKREEAHRAGAAATRIQLEVNGIISSGGWMKYLGNKKQIEKDAEDLDTAQKNLSTATTRRTTLAHQLAVLQNAFTVQEARSRDPNATKEQKETAETQKRMLEGPIASSVEAYNILDQQVKDFGAEVEALKALRQARSTAVSAHGRTDDKTTGKAHKQAREQMKQPPAPPQATKARPGEVKTAPVGPPGSKGPLGSTPLPKKPLTNKEKKQGLLHDFGSSP